MKTPSRTAGRPTPVCSPCSAREAGTELVKSSCRVAEIKFSCLKGQVSICRAGFLSPGVFQIARQ